MVHQTFFYLLRTRIICHFIQIFNQAYSWIRQSSMVTSLKDIRAIELVQRRATKLIPSMTGLTYSERLLKLGLPTLQYRRDRQDLIHVYNILNSNPESSLFSIDYSNRLRGNGRKLKKTEHYIKQTRQQFFSQRVINTWNNLPADAVQAKSINSFKSTLNALNWHPNKFVAAWF